MRESRSRDGYDRQTRWVRGGGQCGGGVVYGVVVVEEEGALKVEEEGVVVQIKNKRKQGGR